MSDKNKKEGGWYTTGKYFGITKQRQIEIFEDLREKIHEEKRIDDVEKYIAKTYNKPAEAFVAGFAFCYAMAARKVQEDIMTRRLFWDWLLGIPAGPINLFGNPFPVELIESIALGKDPTEGLRRSIEEYKEYVEKKKQQIEVA
jgi:hypothetical protein